MYHNMLIPLDGSPPSEHAATLGLELARQLGASGVFVHVLEPHRYQELNDVDEAKAQARTLGQNLLEHWQRKAKRRHARFKVRLEERSDVAETLCEAVHAEGCDLIVIGSHGRTGLPRLLLGSVTERVARLAAVPVLLVRNFGHEPTRFEHLLVAVDGSESSWQALRHANQLAEALKSRLSIVHVAYDAAYAPTSLGRYLALTDENTLKIHFEEARERLRTHGQSILEKARGYCHSSRVQTLLRESKYELTSTVISHVADEVQADLIVLGTSGVTGLRRWLLGSVASDVIHQAHRAVLLVRTGASESSQTDTKVEASAP